MIFKIYIRYIFILWNKLDKVPRINIEQKCFLRFLSRVQVKEVSLKLITGIVLKKEKGNDNISRNKEMKSQMFTREKRIIRMLHRIKTFVELYN